MVQQTQPLLSWMICSCVSLTRMSLSMFSSPNSFSMTAIFWPCASVSTRLSSVVLPEPRKPVRMVAGISPGAGLVAGFAAAVSGTDDMVNDQSMEKLGPGNWGRMTVFQANVNVNRLFWRLLNDGTHDSV